MASFFDLARSRKSCRKFSTSPVGKEKIEKILACARLAPSACNAQPWYFHVVTSQPLLGKVAKSLQEMKMNGFTSQAPCFIVIQEGESNTSAAFGARLKKQDYTAYDVGLATAHICYSAMELGLGTCILGWFSQKSLKDALQLSDKPVRLVIALGYEQRPKAALDEKKRKDLSQIVTYYES